MAIIIIKENSALFLSLVLFQNLVLFSLLLYIGQATVGAVDSGEHTLEPPQFVHVLSHHQTRWRDDEWEMVERQGKQFVVAGKPFYVNGFNAYWLMLLAADQSTRGKVSDVFKQASSVSLTVCRTWAFNDGGWRALQKSPSVYDEQVFRALDFVVNEASKYGIRLILVLVNNWEGLGGKAQYVAWAKAAGLNLTSDEDFFTDPTVKAYYKAHVKTVLNRVNTVTNITYKDDPTIFSWELMNEPRCLSDPSGNKLQDWIQEMAVHFKSVDSAHLLGTGAEGFYGPSTPDKLQVNPNTVAGQVGTDFIRNHKTLGIDYASAHIYPDIWVSKSASDDHLRFAAAWVQSHVEDGDEALRMPVVFGEYGVSSKDGGFNSTFRNLFIGAVYSALLNSTRQGGSGGGCLLWQLLPEGTEYMDDGYGVVLSKAHNISAVIALQSKRLQIFNSRCAWKCRWSCKRKAPNDIDSLRRRHDEL